MTLESSSAEQKRTSLSSSSSSPPLTLSSSLSSTPLYLKSNLHFHPLFKKKPHILCNPINPQSTETSIHKTIKQNMSLSDHAVDQDSTVGDHHRTITSLLHPDIINTQILTRLDGPALASISCASTHIQTLINSDNELWRNIAISTWPSVTHPKLQSLISNFPYQHRSLFSDSFPPLSPRQLTVPNHQQKHHHNRASIHEEDRTIVSAVDLFYNKEPIFTRVVESECDSGWFHGSPFRIDMLESNESVPIPCPISQFPNDSVSIGNDSSNDDVLKRDLEENLTLSWILIDPVVNKSVNLSSFRPVFARRRWSSGDVQVIFATVLKMGEEEEIQCRITVTCGEKGKVDVRELSMHLEDMEGKNLCGEYGVSVLGAAVEYGERRSVKKGEMKERYEKYLERRRERRVEKDRRERLLDLVFIGVSVTVFVSFWGFTLFW